MRSVPFRPVLLMSITNLHGGMVGLRRRTVLRLGGAGLVAGLAGCADLLGGAGGGDSRTATLTPAPLPTVDAAAAQVPPVGAVTGVGPLRLVVTGVERSRNARVLGTELRALGDDEILGLSTAFENAGDRYLAVDVDRYDVVHDDGFAESIEPFAGLRSSSVGGWAFAPGERRRVELHYQLPPGVPGAELRVAMRLRALPDESVAVGSARVDLTSVAASPGQLGGSLSAPLHGVGDGVDAAGLSVAVRAVESSVEVPNWTPPPGFEHLGFNLSVRNEVEPPAPVVVALGRFGGMTLADDDGHEFTERVWFDGTVAGGRHYEGSTAVLPGGTNEGTVLAVVPTDAVPLYLFWTPPSAYWWAGSGVAVNRFVWRLR